MIPVVSSDLCFDEPELDCDGEVSYGQYINEDAYNHDLSKNLAIPCWYVTDSVKECDVITIVEAYVKFEKNAMSRISDFNKLIEYASDKIDAGVLNRIKELDISESEKVLELRNAVIVVVSTRIEEKLGNNKIYIVISNYDNYTTYVVAISEELDTDSYPCYVAVSANIVDIMCARFPDIYDDDEDDDDCRSYKLEELIPMGWSMQFYFKDLDIALPKTNETYHIDLTDDSYNNDADKDAEVLRYLKDDYFEKYACSKEMTETFKLNKGRVFALLHLMNAVLYHNVKYNLDIDTIVSKEQNIVIKIEGGIDTANKYVQERIGEGYDNF